MSYNSEDVEDFSYHYSQRCDWCERLYPRNELYEFDGSLVCADCEVDILYDDD